MKICKDHVTCVYSCMH